MRFRSAFLLVLLFLLTFSVSTASAQCAGGKCTVNMQSTFVPPQVAVVPQAVVLSPPVAYYSPGTYTVAPTYQVKKMKLKRSKRGCSGCG